MLGEAIPPLEEEVEELNDVELPADEPLPKVFAAPFGFLDILLEAVVIGTGAFV
jgi:hypothetical protein